MMNRGLSTISAGLLATAAMTAFSYSLSAVTGRNYREPDLLARILRTETTDHPLAGWLMHAAFGSAWAPVELPYLEKAPNRDVLKPVLALLSAAAAILTWELLFRASRYRGSRRRFLLHLFPAHFVYTYALTVAEGLLAPHDSGSETQALAASNSSSG